MIGQPLTQPATAWPTPCCDITPVSHRPGAYACRGCGRVYVDGKREVFRIFGEGVVTQIALTEEPTTPFELDLSYERWMDA